MTILMITDFYAPYLGGVEQHVRSLARTLAARGHSVTVATLTRPDLPDQELDGLVTVRRIRSTTQRFALFSASERPWAPPIADPEVTRALRTIMIEVAPDIVHGHDWLARSFLPLRRWSERRFGTRYITSLHYYTLSCAKKNLMHVTADAAGSTCERPCDGPAVRKCLACAGRHFGPLKGAVTASTNVVGARAERRGAATVLAVSAATARGNDLDPGSAPVQVVPNFLPPASSAPLAASDASLVEQLPAGPFLLFVGDLRPMKGLDVLLQAYAALEPELPLVLIGKSWPDTPAAMPPGVVVFDRWPNAAVLEAWQRCTIAVVPSVWAEPFGIVVIEAMAGGCAVVASDCGGIPEIIEDGVNGVLVPPGDAESLHRVLAALVTDPERVAALGAAARVRADAFTATAVVPRIEAVYRTALARHSRSRTTSR